MNVYEKREFDYIVQELLKLESVAWFVKNIIFNGTTNEEMLAWKVLRTHFKKDVCDERFRLVNELVLWVWRNHYHRGLDTSQKEIMQRNW